MPLELYFEIEGEAQLVRRLMDVDLSMKDFTPEFRQVGSLLKKTFRDNFNTAGNDLGAAWQPLSPRTIREKIRQGWPLDILIRTNRMKNSFRDRVSNLFVVVDNTAPYFPYHQSNKPRRKLPRRIMMRIDNRRRNQIVKIFQSGVQRKLQDRGFTP